MPKNAIHVSHPKQDIYDQMHDGYLKNIEFKHQAISFLKELRESLVRECSLIGGSAMVRSKIDKFLEDNS